MTVLVQGALVMHQITLSAALQAKIVAVSVFGVRFPALTQSVFTYALLIVSRIPRTRPVVRAFPSTISSASPGESAVAIQGFCPC